MTFTPSPVPRFISANGLHLFTIAGSSFHFWTLPGQAVEFELGGNVKAPQN